MLVFSPLSLKIGMVFEISHCLFVYCLVIFVNKKEIGVRKLAKIKEYRGKILGKLPTTTKIPLLVNGMAAISKNEF